MNRPDPEAVLVLLGYDNTDAGELCEDTKLRCATALSLLSKNESWIVIATGAFGSGFNRSAVAHGELIGRHLRASGLEAERILPPTFTSRTFEDAFAARPAVMKFSPAKIAIVTSDFHVARAEYIFRRVYPDIELEFHQAPSSPNDGRDSREASKLMRQQQDWVDGPLWRTDNAELPAEIYNNCSEEQKHYDRMSYLMVAGAFISFAFPYLLNESWPSWVRVAALLVSPVFIILLFCLYSRAASLANTARQVMYICELQWQIGFSTTSRRGHLVQSVPVGMMQGSMNLGVQRAIAGLSRLTRLGFATTTAVMTFVLVLIQIAAAVIAAWPREESPSTPPTVYIDWTL